MHHRMSKIVGYNNVPRDTSYNMQCSQIHAYEHEYIIYILSKINFESYKSYTHIKNWLFPQPIEVVKVTTTRGKPSSTKTYYFHTSHLTRRKSRIQSWASLCSSVSKLPLPVQLLNNFPCLRKLLDSLQE